MTLKNTKEHLVCDVPNNFATRWLVKKFVQKMSKSRSRWTLAMRYRKPYKDYMYNRFGDRVFSLYLRTRRVKGDLWR